MSIYHLFTNATGAYSGSGVFQLRNEEYNFTTIDPPPFEFDENSFDDEIPTLYFDGENWGDTPTQHDIPDPSEYLPQTPIPASVRRYQFLGQLAKEATQNEILPPNVRITDFLHAAVDQATEEQIPESLKAEAHNEIDEAESFLRLHPFIPLFGPVFSYETEEEQDQFFVRASNYKFGVE